MKKIVAGMLFLLCCVIISACSNTQNTNTSSHSEPADDKQQTNDSQQSDHKLDEKESTDSINKPEEEVKPKYKVSDVWSIVPIEDHINKRVVLITIDDAPGKYALKMAQTLKNMDVNAIFFVNGHLLETTKKKEMLKQLNDMGFVIGNHTYSHASLPDLSKIEQRKEIIRVNDMVEEIIGERPKFFRAPNGENTDYSKQIAQEEGMTLMNWSYGYDWNKEYMSKDALTDIMINTNLLVNGANLLMHDRKWTEAALEDIVKGLRDKGYELVDPKLIRTTK
ncbi:polysaccharide deacetylase family protein [Virgibacillus oceani]|uniref:NodB homology domain-containing protein n=1 Tax=Virgibacillus oceani TaxID=1479511 RepID=A0A917H6Y6_9BACI|nr:polysaccharide deacetylase family protein [Virgibacillus oceani]GGG70149.1 hypothetical protein GCM10011398_12760 [Virgibacillus oceani]